MKKLLLSSLAIVLIFVSAISYSRDTRTREEYTSELKLAVAEGNFKRIEEILNDATKLDDLDIRLGAKAMLYNFYQGKCGPINMNELPNINFSSEELIKKCKAFTNLKKAVIMLEDFVDDWEDNVNQEDKIYHPGISYATRTLARIYGDDSFTQKAGIRIDMKKAEKYQAIYDKLLKFRD